LALLDRGEGRTQPFANPKKALFWFGWRRHGRMLAGCGLFFCAVGLAFGLCSQDFWYGPPGQQFTVLLAFAGIPVILTGGLVGTLLIFIRDGEDFYSGGRGFFLTLPARSVDMARQRLYASAAGIGVIMAGMSAIMLLLSPLAIESSETVGSVILLLLAAAGGAWVGMWFLVPGALLFVATAVALAVSAFVFSVVFRVDNVMTAGAALAAIAFAVIAWRKLPDRINTIVLALVACGTLLVLGQLIANGYELRTLNYVVVLLVPAPLAVLPLALDWWRHR
jgi:hypothetical protein